MKFLNLLEKDWPADQEVRLITDHSCTHKSAEVERWLKSRNRKRFHYLCTPASISWLNHVKRFFALITGRMIRRGTCHGANELEKAIYRWLASRNVDPAPFIWKASSKVTLDTFRRRKALPVTVD